MILSITEQYHDYEPRQYLVDSEKLDASNYVDAALIKASKRKASQTTVDIDASNWEERPEFGGCEPGISGKAILRKKKGVKIDKSIFLTVDFNC